MDKLFLKLHTAPQPNEHGVKVGDTFEIEEEDENLVVIIVNGYLMGFSKEPDFEGNSYAKWFDIITEVE